MMKEFNYDDISKSGIVSLDIEYDPAYEVHDEDFRDNFWGTGLSYHKEGQIQTYWIRDFKVIQELLDFLCENDIEIVGHYFQSDLVGFRKAGFAFKKDPIIRCTAIAWNYIEDEWTDRDLGLKTLSAKILGRERSSFEDNCDYGPDSVEFEKYAKQDVYDQLELYTLAEKKLKELGLFKTYLITTSSIVPFSDMICAGMPFDMDEAEDLYHKIGVLQDEIEHNIYQMIGKIDLNSSKQLSNRLFGELKWPTNGLKRGKSGQWPTGVQVIEKLASKYPAAELISAYRSCAKMVSTYLEPLLEQYERWGRVYDYYFLTSKTGRTRTRRIQLIPKTLGSNIKHNETLKAAFADLNLRKLFKVTKGRKLVVRDFSSLEYRTSAIAANDLVMIDMYQSYECKKCGCKGKSSTCINECPDCSESDPKLFEHGKDLHNFVRDTSNSVGAGIDRNRAKNVSFCTVFGGSAYRLSQMLNLDVKKCEKIQKALLNQFKGIHRWHKDSARIVDTTGEVRDFFGRRRKINLKKRLEGKPSQNHEWIRKGAINEIVNVQAQSPGCLIGQIALRNTRKSLIKKGLWDRCDIIGFIHDEIILETDEEIAAECDAILKHEMENAVKVSVPLKTEGSVGDSWYECK